MRKAFKWIFAILVIASVFCGVGCKPEVEVKPAEKKTGTIQGKAFYSNENVDNHSGIQITLVSTDGLMATDFCSSRGITTNARSVKDIKTTAKDGSYSFENIPVGVYTVYASSNSSVEKAVATNISVNANQTVTTEDLKLTATGTIKGDITIDGKTDGVLGLDVFIAGTSFDGKVGLDGSFELTSIPAKKGYVLCVQKGDYITILDKNLEVLGNGTVKIQTVNILSENWKQDNSIQEYPTFKWLGVFASAPKNPDLYDAYYNTEDGCSYIWNGSNWDLLAQAGKDGVDGEHGVDGKDGLSIVWKGALEAAPENPKLYWAYYNTTDGCSYIWNGNDWDLLAQGGKDGADGEDGKDGTNGKDGEDGKDGVNGTDGKDGVDGLSIVWKGELEAAPENPELYWAYYNIKDGCSYIWNGNEWDLLAKSGEDGADGEDGKDGTNGKDGVDGQSIVWKGELEAAPENPELYWAYYNTTDGCSYIWNGSDWDLLAQAGKDGADGTNGKDGEDGKDGVNGIDGKDGVDGQSIVWKGALEAAPENPELNWAYYNIYTGCSYIWNGNDWDLLAKSGEDGVDGEDGKDGTNGKDGEDGKDGVDGLSIVWKGELEVAPENPELYWAYYNTTDGCSYIWNGSDWDLLAKSGEDGADGEDGKDGTNGKDGEDGKDGVNGTDGKDGVDGQSIVWKGALEAAPENPELYWAYYNTTDGGSYIWNGSSWDLLTQHANHTFNEWTVVTAPTCETEGKEERTCTVCLYKEEQSIPFDHSYGTWNVTTEPKTNAQGRNERTCSYCGYVDSVVLQPAPEGFRFVKGTTITGTESWTPSSSVFVSGRILTIPDLIVSDHEVTRGEYKAVMGRDPSDASAYNKDGTPLTGDAVLNNPVNYVNWYDVLVYCNKLSIKENLTPCYSIDGSTNPDGWGEVPTSRNSTWNAATCNFDANGYRLPTEAEWEWLARGGENYEYAGSDTIDDVAWYTENTNDTGTREVKTKAPNGYGLYDMSGNVFEWCWDWYDAPISSSSSLFFRVPRGGCWCCYDYGCPVASRSIDNPSYRYYAIGFRVVRTAK